MPSSPFPLALQCWVGCALALCRVGCGAATKPLSQVDPADIFSTVKRADDAAPGPVFGRRSVPLPTNAWWENVAIAEDSSTPEGNIFQMPYVVLADAEGLHAMQPFKTGATSQGFDKVEALTLGSVEALGGPQAADWDQLTLTLSWGGDDGDAGVRVPIVRGSPYVTAEYAGATPRLSTEQQLRPDDVGQFTLEVDGNSQPCEAGATVSGKVLTFELVQSDATWAVFSPPDVEWSCTPEPFSLTARQPLRDGAVRAAIANSCTTGVRPHHCEGFPAGRDSSAYMDLLTTHAGAYPVSVSVDYTVADDLGKVTWEWGAQSLPGHADEAPPLQLAYPVHIPLLSSDALDSVQGDALSTPFRDIRGITRPVVGKAWELTYRLFPDVGLAAPRPIAKGLQKDMLKALRGPEGALWNGSMPDKDFDLPLNYRLGVGDTYFAGKMLARLARLIVIADELGESKEAYFSDMVTRLTDRMEVWFHEDAQAPFIYDASWGGLLSCGCSYDDCGGQCDPYCSNDKSGAECPALTLPGMNFGNAYYNDHHFHYGYYVYGAAVAAKYAPAWEKKWREQILMIVRDYANPSSEDSSFPLARHKDWFLGTSWAGGIPMAYENGRNQESTSESLHSYYAVYTYGASVDAPFAKDLKDFGRLMTAMESHGADTYWHVRKNVGIYDDDFPEQVIGILWDHVVEHQTWFGGAPYIVSGIQLLPFIPAMENYLDKEWVEKDSAVYKQECAEDAGCAQGWSWPMCLEQAVLDPVGARECMSSLPDDAFSTGNAAANGNSLTNSLHWIATRPESCEAFGGPDSDCSSDGWKRLVAKEDNGHVEAPPAEEKRHGQESSTTAATTSTTRAATEAATRASSRPASATTSAEVLSTAGAPRLPATANDASSGDGDSRGDAIRSGDEIFLRAHTGSYVDVQGTKVKARWDIQAGWERMNIEKQGGGALQSDDTVFLLANTQAYLDVAGSVVGARWPNKRQAQEFVIQKDGGDSPEIRHGDKVFLTAHTGNLLEVKGLDVFAKSTEHGASQVFTIELSQHAPATTSEKLWIVGDDASRPPSPSGTKDALLKWAQLGLVKDVEVDVRALGQDAMSKYDSTNRGDQLSRPGNIALSKAEILAVAVCVACLSLLTFVSVRRGVAQRLRPRPRPMTYEPCEEALAP